MAFQVLNEFFIVVHSLFDIRPQKRVFRLYKRGRHFVYIALHFCDFAVNALYGDYYITVDLSEYFTIRAFDTESGKFKEDDVTDIIKNYSVLKFHYDENGARNSSQSLNKQAVKRGVTAMKWDPFGKNYLQISNAELDRALRCIQAVREAVGNEVDMLIEAHGRFDVPTSIKIAQEIAPFKPMFLEEPVPPNNLEALKAVREKSPVAISAGERLYTRFDYNALFQMRACDYIQPDVSHAGGIMELKKIAAVAESHYIPFAPHNPSGPIANAATLQLVACCPNFCILEIMYSDVEYRKEITDEKLVYENGYLKIGDRPGLGIELNEEACSKYPYKKHELRHYTGELTDIRPARTAFYF